MSEVDDHVEEGPHHRGKGRGRLFSVLGRAVWDDLWEITTENRLNLVATFLVLLAGTGADQRLTKWSAKACEDYVGIGKPRARRAIEELIAGGLIERTEAFTRLSPQYRLPDVSEDEDPIFLPVQMITGVGREQPILRRVRESGDAMLLRMLIDIYGMVAWDDPTYGVPLANLRRQSHDETRKIAEVGVHVLWATPSPQDRAGTSAAGDWCSLHRVGKSPKENWEPFWDRLRLLEKMGALWFEPWVFESASLDAEPLFPIDFSVLYAKGQDDDVAVLSRTLVAIAERMTEDREYLLERYANDFCVARAAHQQPPAIRGVAKPLIEPDTPGFRLSYRRRKELIETHQSAYNALLNDLADGIYDRPLGSPREEVA